MPSVVKLPCHVCQLGPSPVVLEKVSENNCTVCACAEGEIQEATKATQSGTRQHRSRLMESSGDLHTTAAAIRPGGRSPCCPPLWGRLVSSATGRRSVG